MAKGGAPSERHKKRMDDIIEKIQRELDKYDAIPMAPAPDLVTAPGSPASPSYDLFMMDVKLNTLIRWIKEKLTESEQEDFDYMAKEVMLDNLVSFREAFEPMIREARSAAIRARIMGGERLH